ncbi:37482_t:CDS:1, partial [Gigaspora margarita]
HITYDILPTNRSYKIDTSSNGDFENELYTIAAIGNIKGDISSNNSKNKSNIVTTIRNNKDDIFENKNSEDNISSDNSENEPDIAATIRNTKGNLFENKESGDEMKIAL